jgi:hypothetical protein
MAGHVARMEETKYAYRILVGKLLQGPRRWEGNTKMDLKK